jgi:SAM-dependent methyltransferase
LNPRPQDTVLLNEIRRKELQLLKSEVEPGCKLLEFGGALGFQAKILSEWGAEVSSIDIIDQDPQFAFFPVTKYDGYNFPFDDRAFDIIYSSGAITQVKEGEHLEKILSEMRRVLKPGGRAIHMIPTPAWRFNTSLAHPFFMAERLIRKLLRKRAPSSSGGATSRPGILKNARHAFFGSPATAQETVWQELLSFRERRWTSIFEKAGFVVERVEPTNLFYTGHVRFEWLNIPTRRILSDFLGSSTKFYFTRML